MSKPTILLYDPSSASWAPLLQEFCAAHDMLFRAVQDRDLARSVGALSKGDPPLRMPPPSPPLPEPMLVLCGLSLSQLDRLLAALRRLGVPRTVLKAVLTPHNNTWSFSRLYQELCRERHTIAGSLPSPHGT